jgi:primosomal protein N' (replication factor Y)
MPENYKYASVLLPGIFDYPFDYLIPEGLKLSVGDFVEVPFGKRNDWGVITNLSDELAQNIPLEKLKSVISNADSNGFAGEKISTLFLDFLKWQAGYYITPLGKVLSLTISNKNLFTKTKERTSVKKTLDENNILKKTSLSDEQIKAVENIKNRLDKFSVTLLDGVTGSGKTEVFFEAIKQVIAQQKQVIILLPEILLTNQIISRFKDNLGFEPNIWHSNLTPKQRKTNWHKAANGEAKIIIGARSALFLPFKNLGLIVVDEEHDASYKQDESVIYNARDMAIMRAKFEDFPVILSSATPSLETHLNAATNKYFYEKLQNRYNQAELPEIDLIDMRREYLSAKEFISTKLKTEIAKTLANKQQVLLFLNRRGYAPLTLCSNCGYRFQSPDTTAWMVQHRSANGEIYLQCHHSGFKIKLPEKCPACAVEDSFRACGPGVERLFEEVKNLFPEAKIEIVTSDTVSTAKKSAEVIEKITSGEIDIIIGTQMISKGHNFPSLSLVGVIDGDLGLDGSDPKAIERTYQVLHQVSGRAGRFTNKGLVFIQTFNPENKVMQSLKNNDREGFYKYEIETRQMANLPPFSRFVGLVVSSKNQTEALKYARQITSLFEAARGVKIFGPTEAFYHQLRGNYRYRILVKAEKNFKIQDYIKSNPMLKKIPNEIKVKIDVDPYSLV